LVVDYVFNYYLETEIPLRVVVLAKLNPLNYKIIKENIFDTENIFIVEESDGKYGLSSEIISNLSEDIDFKNKKFKRITSKTGVIPASIELENKFLINKEKFFDIINNHLKDA